MPRKRFTAESGQPDEHDGNVTLGTPGFNGVMILQIRAVLIQVV